MLNLILKPKLREHVNDTMVINYLHELNLKRIGILINMVNMIIQLIPKFKKKQISFYSKANTILILKLYIKKIIIFHYFSIK